MFDPESEHEIRHFWLHYFCCCQVYCCAAILLFCLLDLEKRADVVNIKCLVTVLFHVNPPNIIYSYNCTCPFTCFNYGLGFWGTLAVKTTAILLSIFRESKSAPNSQTNEILTRQCLTKKKTTGVCLSVNNCVSGRTASIKTVSGLSKWHKSR